MLRHWIVEIKLLIWTTCYLAHGVVISIFPCNLELIRSDVGVENGPSNVSLYPTKFCNILYVSLFWGRTLPTIWLYVTLVPWGTSFMWMKKEVVVPLISPINL